MRIVQDEKNSRLFDRSGSPSCARISNSGACAVFEAKNSLVPGVFTISTQFFTQVPSSCHTLGSARLRFSAKEEADYRFGFGVSELLQ